MGRGKVELKRIENTTNRQVTFSKRKNGLLKKAFELSVLCEAEVALITFSPTGKFFHFASHDMDQTIDRYRSVAGLPGSCNNQQRTRSLEFWRSEMDDLKKLADTLEARNQHFTGECLQSLEMKELKQLERQLRIGVERICSRKRRLLSEHLNSLKIRQKALQEENVHLQRKLAMAMDEGTMKHMFRFCEVKLNEMNTNRRNSIGGDPMFDTFQRFDEHGNDGGQAS